MSLIQKKVAVHLFVVHAVAIPNDLRGAFSCVPVILAGPGSLVLDGLHLLFQRSGFCRGQYSLPVTQVVIRHGEDSLIIGHAADDAGHIDKPGQFAGPLAAVSGNDLISATLTGPHQRRLIDISDFDRLHQPLNFRIIPDAKGVIFERVQIGKIEIDNLLFHATGGNL